MENTPPVTDADAHTTMAKTNHLVLAQKQENSAYKGPRRGSLTFPEHQTAKGHEWSRIHLL